MNQILNIEEVRDSREIEERLRKEYRQKTLQMAKEVSASGTYEKVEGMICDWWLEKLHQQLQKAVQEEKLKHCCCVIEDSKVIERCKLHGDELQKARYEERHSLLTTVKAMSWDAKNETPEAIRILKELYDLLSTPDHSELDQGPDAFERQGL